MLSIELNKLLGNSYVQGIRYVIMNEFYGKIILEIKR